MLAAVEFDDEFGFGGAEIGYVLTNRVLSTEGDAQLVMKTRHFAPSYLPHLRPAVFCGSQMGERQY